MAGFTIWRSAALRTMCGALLALGVFSTAFPAASAQATVDAGVCAQLQAEGAIDENGVVLDAAVVASAGATLGLDQSVIQAVLGGGCQTGGGDTGGGDTGGDTGSGTGTGGGDTGSGTGTGGGDTGGGDTGGGGETAGGTGTGEAGSGTGGTGDTGGGSGAMGGAGADANAAGSGTGGAGGTGGATGGAGADANVAAAGAGNSGTGGTNDVSVTALPATGAGPTSTGLAGLFAFLAATLAISGGIAHFAVRQRSIR